MRLAWIAAGVGTASVLSSHSFAAFNYQTVITDGDVGLIGGIKQVVLQDGKRVAAILDNEDLDETLVYKQQGVPASYAVIATAGDSAFGAGGSSDFQTFNNVSFGTDRIVFASTHDDGISTGVYGYQVGGSGYRIIADGATVPGGTFDNTEAAGVTVNAAGEALVSGKLGSTEVIKLGVAGGPALASTVVTDSTNLVINFNDHVGTRGTKKVFSESAGNPVAVFLAEDPNNLNKRIITQARVSDGLLGPSRVTEGNVTFTQGEYGVRPTQLIGATTDATLFAATLSQVSGGPSLANGNYGLVYKDASTTRLVKQFNDPADSVLSEMTATGKAAFIVDNGVYYVDDSLSTAQLLATAGTSVGSTNIQSISLTAAPMVNDSGVVVFQATMSDSKMALLAWNGTSLVELAHEGESITLDGDPTEYVLDLLLPATLNADLPFDHDVLKDGLSDDNHVAFGIAYDGFAAAAVVVMEIPSVAVPEPSSTLLILGAFGGLTLRRRRR